MTSEAAKHPRIVYQASGLRRVVLSLAFLLIMPFALSLPIMLWQRLSQGIWLGTPGLMVLAVGFGIIQVLILLQLVQSVRSRVVLGPDAAEMTLPAGRWLTPLFRYDRHTIRYDDIQAIEKRNEVYGGTLAPVMLSGMRILPKDGPPIRIGYVNAWNEDPALPVLTIGNEIARRAQIEILDRGAVHRSLPKKMLGATSMAGALSFMPIAASTPAIEAADVEAINRRHRTISIAIGAAVVALLAHGIATDLMAPPPGGTPRLAVGSSPPKADAKASPKRPPGDPSRR